jgi:phosphoglycolate phosphatase-like HAD superfamily hydrolase
MLILFWDIDGTLLSTGRAGVYAWEDACEEVTGAKVDFGPLKTSGLTDIEIGALLLRERGVAPEPDRVAEIVGLYERYLPRSLPRKQGQVMPNVREILAAVGDRDDVHSMLLTGNTRAGAHAKLRHYGLAEFFDFEGGAFSDATTDRPSIARRAVEIVQKRGLPDDRERMVVIGDTPHDIHCANAIGVRTLAVATGSHSRDELAEHDPWSVVDTLPDPQDFLDRVAAVPAATEAR